MPVQPPDPTELARIAAHYGLDLSAADLESFSPFVTGLLGSWNAVEDLYARSAPATPTDRTWHRPDDADNPLGAWYVRTDITETDDGPLAGRTDRDQGQHDGRRGPDDERLRDPRGLRPDPGRDRS